MTKCEEKAFKSLLCSQKMQNCAATQKAAALQGAAVVSVGGSRL